MLIFWSYFKDLIPLIATIPLVVAAIWISHRWSSFRRGDAELRAEIAALRDEVDALRREQAQTQERLDYTEHMMSGLRESHSELPKPTQQARERPETTPV
jgi:predicted  nucleic acid-binding Zn-ribbon protein